MRARSVVHRSIRVKRPPPPDRLPPPCRARCFSPRTLCDRGQRDRPADLVYARALRPVLVVVTSCTYGTRALHAIHNRIGFTVITPGTFRRVNTFVREQARVRPHTNAQGDYIIVSTAFVPAFLPCANGVDFNRTFKRFVSNANIPNNGFAKNIFLVFSELFVRFS